MSEYGPHPRNEVSVGSFFAVLGVIFAFAGVGAGGLFLFGEFDSSAGSWASPEPPEEWDPVLEPYVEFIEQERGLEFEHPVAVRYADISSEVAESLAAIREEEAATESPDSIAFADPYGDAYRLLGLVGDSVDPGADADEAIAENAAAFYDPYFQEIVLPEGESELAMSFTIVHELVHALQDQHGLLGGFFDSVDSSQARTALIEGDAERIAHSWFWSLTDSQRDDYFAEIGYDANVSYDESFPGGVTFYETNFFLSYDLGPALVETIVATEGTEELDRLLRAKEIGTTERFIDPLGNSNLSMVDAGSLIDTPQDLLADGDLGVATWFAALSTLAGPDVALDALIGYDDDAFVVYTNDAGETCGFFAIFFDDETEAIEFDDVAVGLLNIPGVEVAGTQVTIDICSPIGNPADQHIGIFYPLVVLNEMALFHISEGESVDVARCASLEQASTIRTYDPANTFVPFDEIVAQSEQFVAACSLG